MMDLYHVSITDAGDGSSSSSSSSLAAAAEPSPLSLGTKHLTRPHTSYDVSDDGTKMIMGTTLVDGVTGAVLHNFPDPNDGSQGAFTSEISGMNCYGNVTILTSFKGLHVFNNNKFHQTVSIKALTGSSYFYPFGNAVLNCEGNLALVVTPSDQHRTNHTVHLIDVQAEGGGKRVHKFPTYTSDSADASYTEGVGIAMSRAGKDGLWSVAIGYPAAHDERGRVDLFRTTAPRNDSSFELVRSIECTSCKVGTRFGLDVDLSSSGDRLLVTMRSQDVEPAVGRRRRGLQSDRNMMMMKFKYNRSVGIRSIAYLFNPDGDLLQSYKHDEMEENGVDFLDVDWRGQIGADGRRVTLTSYFSAKQLRTLVYDASSGEMLAKSATDYVIAVDAEQQRGIGLSTTPTAAIVVYSLEAEPSGGGGARSAALAVAVAATLMILAGAVLFVLQRRRSQRRKASKFHESVSRGADSEEKDTMVDVELPNFS
jgi:hypothetical protein